MSVTKVNKDEFEQTIKEGTIIVDFYADWCGPCKMMGRVIDDLSNELEDVKFIKLNVDEESSIAAKYSIMSIPTIILFENGTMTSKIVGFHSKEELKEFINLNK